MTAGRIAVVITCRDLGRTLLEALQSVERQTRPAAEIVVVDGGSTEIFTRQMLAGLKRAGTRVVDAAGPGASAARNCGARLTSADYLVCLDGDDTLEPGYFEAAAAHLDADPDLDFVSCALRAFGAASYVWSPSPPTFIDAISTGGVPHASTMVRRRLWEKTGGFDETLVSFELFDFWATAIGQGFHGVILDQPLLNYRVRPGSGYRLSIQPETYLDRYRHFYAKHRAAVEEHGVDLIQAKEAFLLSQLEYFHTIESRAKSLEAELSALQHEIAETTRTLESRGSFRVEWGDLRRIQPLSRTMGRDRGKPIDRYYIDGFVESHRSAIQGRVLDVRDRTQRFDTIPTASHDCILLTQTLHLAPDIVDILAECARILRPGGVLLATVPSVTRVEDELGRDGDLWRLTEASARKLFSAVFPVDAFEVSVYGNVMACTALLYGLCAEEMAPADLDRIDPRFPVVIAIRAMKPAVVDSNPSYVVSGFSRTFSAAILAYHRIAKLTPDSHSLCTPPDVFREHMAYIKRECQPMRLEELVEAAATGRIPERAVAVTLDDGYLDALSTASPILTDLGVPATFFVNTDRLNEEHERWWDILERVFLCETIPPALLVQIGRDDVRMPTATAEERAEALRRLNETAWPLDAKARKDLVRDVLAWAGTSGAARSTHRVLTGDEIRELAGRPGHSVGAHTVHHLALTTQPVDTKRVEITENKIALEHLLRQPVRLFSYPYGDFDGDMTGIVSEAGFRAAVTVQAGLVSGATNRLLLPRYEITPRHHGAFAVFLQEVFEGRHVWA